MPELPSQPNLDHLRHQARRLLRYAQAGDAGALERMRAWSTRLTLAAAQLAVAREYGWGSWDALRHYVEALASIAERRQSPPTMDHAPSSGLPSGVWRGEGDVVLRGGKLAAAAAAAVGRLDHHDRPGIPAVDTTGRRGADVASPHSGWGSPSCAQFQEIASTNA